MTTNAGRGAAQEPPEGGGGREGLRARVRAVLDAGPDTWTPYDSRDCGEVFLADSVRDFVVELRALLDQAEAHPMTARTEGYDLSAIATACGEFLAVWCDQDAVSPAFGRPVRMLLDALAVEREVARPELRPDKGMTPITAWTIRCVTCGRDAFQNDDFAGWVDRDGSAASADGVGYELVDGAWYCEEHTPDDEAGDLR